MRSPALRPGALPALVSFVVLVLGVSACAGGEDESEGPEQRTAPPEVRPQKPAPAPPPPTPQAVIRVVDGDSGRPVRNATVVVARERLTTNSGGAVRFDKPRKRVTARVSARGFAPRAVELGFRKRRAQRVPLWQPALQWPIYGANAARTQVHPAIKLRPPFRIVWKRRLHGLLEFPAVVWEGVAYVNNIHGQLRALSMKNGRLLWRKRVGTLMASSPGIDPQRRVLVTTSMEPGDVKVISLDTGRTRWRYDTGGRVEPSPVIKNGVAYVASTNGNVYAFDLDRRRPRWVFRTGAKITSSPALSGNRLFVGDYSGRVFALNARTGRLLWTGSAGSRVYGTVAVSRGKVYAPSVFSGLSALSARTGRVIWRVPVGAYLYSSPAVYRNSVYFGTYGGVVYRVSARSGRVLWVRSAGGGAVSGAVQVVAGLVYAATLRHRTTAWHWRTGRVRWRFGQGKYVPVSGNGQKLLMHGATRIWAVEPKRKRQ